MKTDDGEWKFWVDIFNLNRSGVNIRHVTNCNEGRKEGNVLFKIHSTHFIYGYMVSDIW